MKFEQPSIPQEKPENGEKEDQKESNSELKPLNLSEIVPKGMKIEGVEDLQAGLNDTYERMMEAEKNLFSSLESMKQSIENDPENEEKISIVKRIMDRTNGFLDSIAAPANKRLEQFITWLDRVRS